MISIYAGMGFCPPSGRIVGNSDDGPLGKIRLKGNIEIGGFAARLVEGVIGLIGRRGSVRGLSCLRTVSVLARTEET